MPRGLPRKHPEEVRGTGRQQVDGSYTGTTSVGLGPTRLDGTRDMGRSERKHSSFGTIVGKFNAWTDSKLTLPRSRLMTLQGPRRGTEAPGVGRPCPGSDPRQPTAEMMSSIRRLVEELLTPVQTEEATKVVERLVKHTSFPSAHTGSELAALV